MRIMKNPIKVLLYLFVISFLISCTAQRITRYKNFASAGKSYTDAMVNLLEEAGNVAVDASNEIMVDVREESTREERETDYLEKTEILKEYFSILNDFRSHTLLLNKYFTALATLAESKAGESIGGKAENIVKELNKLHPPLESATIGDASVKEFIGESVPILIGQVRHLALENELKRNAKTIERELELQQALVKALSAEIKADLELISDYFESNFVTLPYVSDGKLPATWKKDRKKMLMLSASASSVHDAESAAQELKEAFISLVENKVKLNDFSALLADINSMIDFIELIRKNRPD